MAAGSGAGFGRIFWQDFCVIRGEHNGNYLEGRDLSNIFVIESTHTDLRNSQKFGPELVNVE